MITGRPPRALRRSRGKRAKKRDSQRALNETIQLANDGHSVPTIASRVRLPRELVERIIGDDPGGEGS